MRTRMTEEVRKLAGKRLDKLSEEDLIVGGQVGGIFEVRTKKEP